MYQALVATITGHENIKYSEAPESSTILTQALPNYPLLDQMTVGLGSIGLSSRFSSPLVFVGISLIRARLSLPQVMVVSGGVRPMIPPPTGSTISGCLRILLPKVMGVSGGVVPITPPSTGTIKSGSRLSLSPQVMVVSGGVTAIIPPPTGSTSSLCMVSA